MENLTANGTLTGLWWAAACIALVHTLVGPDHYLPFIAIAESRGYSLAKTLLWTLFCGLGHVGSALLLSILFVWFSHWLSKEHFQWIEDNRGDLAAYLLVGLGAAYLLWAVRHRLLHRRAAEHHHTSAGKAGISVWILFIIFVLGPCEALLPVLMAAGVMGMSAVITSTIIFSCTTIFTMIFMVTAGMLGLRRLRLTFLQRYAHEVAGITILLCGLLILCGL